MNTQLPDFTAASVLVVGDVMLDRNWHGSAGRISPEAPVPVVKVEDTEDRPGGAANVAMNLAALAAPTALVGVVGQDEAADALTAALQSNAVSSHLVPHQHAKTITKLRVLSGYQQLLRVDFEDQPSAYHAEMKAICQPLLEGCKTLVLSDYGKGALADCQALIALAKAQNIAVVVDPKGADFSRYRGATVITPNAAEFRLVAGDWSDEADLQQRAQSLIEQLELQALLVTRGEQGMSLFTAAGHVQHMPTHALEVFDVTGAGDTVVATLAASLAAGLSLQDAAPLANLAAGLVVAKAGTAKVSALELQRALFNTLQQDREKIEFGVIAEPALLQAMQQARAAGERVVMTNGCFDILHAGHVQYLRQARALGDRLIVAVNDDASVARLKGPTRPVNSLADRMSILAALADVDWVLPFSEDTPERLITAVLPDVLVKGGDYEIADIAGGEAVMAAGGTVQVLSFLEGRSTSDTIKQIQQQ